MVVGDALGLSDGLLTGPLAARHYWRSGHLLLLAILRNVGHPRSMRDMPRGGAKVSAGRARGLDDNGWRLPQRLQPLVTTIMHRERALSDQLRRALTNLALHVLGARSSAPPERTAHAHMALASATEARALLHLAGQRHFCPWGQVKLACAELDAASVALTRLVARPRGEGQRARPRT